MIDTPPIPPTPPHHPYTPSQPSHQQPKALGMLLVLLFGFVSGAVGGGITGYVAASMQQQPQPEQQAQNTTTTHTVVEESETTEVVEKAKPSVVSIVISKELQKQQQSGNQFSGNPFFDQFFGQQAQPESETEDSEGATETVEICSGTGFVISEDGLILTNRHVICEENADYTVIFDDGTTHDAKVLARDQLTDLAILKIEATGLTPIPLADSSTVVQGQTVIAIGNTLGEYSNTVTKGIVSGLSRDIGGNYTGLIQTDAAINEGNSGGPLLNISGEVIGINTAVDRSGEGIGFAIPINEAKVAIDSVKEFGHIVRPALGVRYVPIDAAVAEANSLPYEYGAYIRSDLQNQFGVIPGSAADKAGLEEGDIILEIDGAKIDADNTLPEIIKSHVIGDVITVRVYHDGEEKDVQITLEELPQTEKTTE
jgi:S1-C subfamily serine protease